MKRLIGAAAALVLTVALAGCGSSSDAGSGGGGDKELVVFAAASLTESFTEIGKLFEKEHAGTTVRFNFAASSALAQQIVQGAPADVFAAASPATMGQVPNVSPEVFVKNSLIIAVPKGNPAKITSLKDLTDPSVKVALCAEQVPCGAAAVKALKAAGITVKPVTLEQDVKATLTKVELGEVDAALVYRTDVKSAAGKVDGIEFPESAQAINDYPIAVLPKAPQPELAKQFVALVRSEQGRSILTRVGFDLP
nr:molybdate ABC transporter substrate-binding protein [Rhizohabitans arisaemae]